MCSETYQSRRMKEWIRNTATFVCLMLAVLFLIGCRQSYDTADEAMKENYSGKIEDLHFCDIQVTDSNEPFEGYIHIPFIGLEDIKECSNLKNYCLNYNTSCSWVITTSAESWGGPWYAKHQAICHCKI